LQIFSAQFITHIAIAAPATQKRLQYT